MPVLVAAESAQGNLTKLKMDNWIEAHRETFTDDELYDLDRAKRLRVYVLFASFIGGFWVSRRFLKI